MSTLLSHYLAFWARLFVRRTGTRIVAVTGSAGKTTAKEAVAAVLSAGAVPARAVRGNFNVPFGVAMGILGGGWDARYYASGGGSWYWFKAACTAPFLALFSRPRERVVVAEYGADRPGDIGWLAERFTPEVAVVTTVGEVPVHVEFYASPNEVAAEKAKLVRALPVDGLAVLNADDQTVLDMKTKSPAGVLTFGLGPGADVHVEDLELTPAGVTFTLSSDRASMPVRVRGTLGRGIALAAAAAVAVGKRFGVGLAAASEALSRLTPPPGRMRLLPGIKGSLIVDDTYNASPAAMHLALDAVSALPGRKILVLGDMRELGEHSPKAHQAAGELAGGVAHTLVCVGEGGRLMREAAATHVPAERLFWYADSAAAGPAVQKLIQQGDVVLVKGSQGVRMERIVAELMAEPQRAGELLVRQGPRWLAK